MFINPIVVGVASTIFVEIVIVIVLAISFGHNK